MVNTNNTKSVRKVRKAKARRKLSSRELKKARDRFLNSNIGQTVIPLNKSAEYSAQYAFEVLYDSPEAVGLPENLKWFHDNEGKSEAARMAHTLFNRGGNMYAHPLAKNRRWAPSGRALHSLASRSCPPNRGAREGSGTDFEERVLRRTKKTGCVLQRTH